MVADWEAQMEETSLELWQLQFMQSNRLRSLWLLVKAETDCVVGGDKEGRKLQGFDILDAVDGVEDHFDVDVTVSRYDYVRLCQLGLSIPAGLSLVA